MKITYVSAGARISADGKYRYRLWREWRGGELWNWWENGGRPVLDGSGQPIGEPKVCLFVMLNPSTADGVKDDSTIRKCVGFARRWGYDRLDVVNLFAYRVTNPHRLLALNHDDDPVGWENQRSIHESSADADIVVAAWGAHGGHLGQDETALGWLACDKPVMCLGETADGHPRHPLYVPYDTELRPFRRAMQDARK